MFSKCHSDSWAGGISASNLSASAASSKEKSPKVRTSASSRFEAQSVRYSSRDKVAAAGVDAGVEVVKVTATFASTVASIAVSASRVPRTPASTVAGMSGVGRDAVCVSAGDGASLVQATAVRPKITKTIRMIILIFFLQFCENFQSSLSTGSEADYETNG